jgi:hypothetical protein
MCPRVREFRSRCQPSRRPDHCTPIASGGYTCNRTQDGLSDQIKSDKRAVFAFPPSACVRLMYQFFVGVWRANQPDCFRRESIGYCSLSFLMTSSDASNVVNVHVDCIAFPAHKGASNATRSPLRSAIFSGSERPSRQDAAATCEVTRLITL